MNKPQIKDQDVLDACRNIIQRGLPLTVRNVRDEVGGGSFTTLSPLISRFRHGLTHYADAKINPPPLPKEIESHVLQSASDLWIKFFKITAPAKEELEKQHETKINSLLSELGEAREEIAGHSLEISNLETALAKKEVDAEKLKKKNSEKEGQLALIKAQLSDRENELRLLLERAVTAESRLETIKTSADGINNKAPTVTER